MRTWFDHVLLFSAEVGSRNVDESVEYTVMFL